MLVGLSHKVRNFQELDIKVTGDLDGKGGKKKVKFDVEEVTERALNKSIASTWKLSLLGFADSQQMQPKRFSLSIKPR